MGAAAQVNKLTLTVKRDDFTLRDAGDNLSFVCFAHLGKEANGVIARHFFAADREVFFDDGSHLRFDAFQILRCEGTLVLKVVVESTLDNGANRYLDFRKEAFDCLRHEMGSRMAQDFEPFRRGREDRLGLLSDQGRRHVYGFPIHSGGNSF